MDLPQSDLLHESERLAGAVLAARTIKEYGKDWKVFDQWCRAAQREPLPADSDTLAMFIAQSLETKKIRTILRYCCAILHYHRSLGHGDPDMKRASAILNGAQRLRGERPVQKTPLSVAQLREMVESLADEEEPRRTRDRAVLLFGFATALRRSSIAAARLEHVRFTPEGMIVHVPREKQDQEGKGREIGVPLARDHTVCAVRALQSWLDRRGREPGWLFDGLRNGIFRPDRPMHHNTVAAIVKRAVRSIGLDPARYAGHSLRAGFVTAALEAGAGEIVTARHTGHRSLATLRMYFRPESPFRGNVCPMIGL